MQHGLNGSLGGRPRTGKKAAIFAGFCGRLHFFGCGTHLFDPGMVGFLGSFCFARLRLGGFLGTEAYI